MLMLTKIRLYNIEGGKIMYIHRSRKVLLVLLCLAVYSIIFPMHGKAISSKTWNSYTKKNINTQRWMTSLPDSVSLSALSIPGTHDTMSYNGYITWQFTRPLAQTQTMTLNEQLNAGIRFFDIRAKEDLNIYHGPIYLNASLEEVLHTFTSFLKENPKEVVIMRLKDENKSENSFDYRIQPLIHNLKSFFYTESARNTSSKTPTLRKLRGKILLLSDNNTKKPLVINSSRYGMQYDSSEQVIQDDYNGPDVNTKYQEIVQTAYQACRQRSPENKLFLNYVSATSLTFTPSQYADKLNSKVENFVDNLTANNLNGVGMLIMDFPEKQTIHSIIKNNKFN